MSCPWDCFTIGGRWISENPHCPIHGLDADENMSDEERDRLEDDERRRQSNEIRYDDYENYILENEDD